MIAIQRGWKRVIVGLTLGIAFQGVATGAEWSVTVEPGFQAELITRGGASAMAVQLLELPAPQPDGIRLGHDLGPVSVGSGKIRFQARADWGRTIGIALRSNAPMINGLAPPVRDIFLDADWKDFEFDLVISQNDSNARFEFLLGSDQAAVEVRNVLWQSGAARLPLAPPVIQPGPIEQASAAEPVLANPPPASNPAPPAGKPPGLAPEADLPGKLILQAGGDARRQRNPDGSQRIEIVNPSRDTWAIQLMFQVDPIQQEIDYRLLLRVRADQPRSISVAGSLNQPPWSSFGLYKTLSIGPEWKDEVISFKGTANVAPARIYLDLGGSPGNVEIARVELSSQGRVQSLASPVAGNDPAPPAPPSPTPTPAPPKPADEPKPMPPVEAPIQANVSAASPKDFQLWNAPEVRATLSVPNDGPPRWRAVVEPGARQPWQAQVNLSGIDLVKGESAVLSFRARADQPRPLQVTISMNQEPWSQAGLFQRVDLKPEWSTFSFPFVSTVDMKGGKIEFDVADSPVPVEVADVRLASSRSSTAPATADAGPKQPVPGSAPDATPWQFVADGVPGEWSIVSGDPWVGRARFLSAARNPADARLTRQIQLQPGGNVSFVLRTDGPTRIPCLLSNAQGWKSNQIIELKPKEWQRISLPLPADAPSGPGTIALHFGAAPAVIEISH